jgi:hypothetical protein
MNAHSRRKKFIGKKGGFDEQTVDRMMRAYDGASLGEESEIASLLKLF